MEKPPQWRRLAWRGLLLVVTGVSLYVLLPSLVAVFSSWRSLGHLAWPFAIGVLVCEAASTTCLWQLERVALHTRAWFPVAASQLSGNVVGRVLPGGGATATAFSVSMLRRAGVDTGQATAAFATATLLQISTALSLPILALPAMLAGVPVAHNLAVAAYLGIAVLVVLLGVAVLCFVRDEPLQLAGRVTQWLLNHTTRRRHPAAGLPEAFVAARDFVRSTLGHGRRRASLAAAGNTGFDYLALLCALRAVGASPQPSLVVLAYAAAEVLALIPFTPGGLGFVEAGLVGTLTLAGVPAHAALTSTLLYRLVAYWLPLPVGGAAFLLFRRRYRGHLTPGDTPPASSSPAARSSAD